MYIPTDVYLSLKGDVIPDRGYVLISDIDSTDDTALLCHTNLPTIITDPGRGWFAPDGIRVFGGAVPGFTLSRAPMVARLRRTTGPPPEGIYNCTIDDASSTTQTVFVGLYTSGRGNGDPTNLSHLNLMLQVN